MTFPPPPPTPPHIPPPTPPGSGYVPPPVPAPKKASSLVPLLIVGAIVTVLLMAGAAAAIMIVLMNRGAFSPAGPAVDALPAADADEFYHADLIGLVAVAPDGRTLGAVVAVPNFGAGDLLEIAPPGAASLLVPFTKAVVTEIDLAGGRIVVDAPEFAAPAADAGDPT